MKSILFRLSGLAALALILATAACSGLNPRLQNPDSVCEADRWTVVPTHVFTMPGPAGLKIVYVPLAVENNSRYWGQVDTSAGDPIRQSNLLTDAGTAYPALQQVQIDVELRDMAQMNHLRFLSSQLYTQGLPYLPPGFARGGEVMIGFDPVEHGYGTPSTWSQAVYTLAEEQTPLKINIPSLRLTCLGADGELHQETTGPLELDLKKGVRQPRYPTARADSEFSSLSQPISLPDDSLLELRSMQYADGMTGIPYLVLDFKLDRTGPGSGEAVSFNPVLIGDDGLTRRPTQVYGPPECRALEEPGELRLCYQVGSQAGNFKLLWVDEAYGVYQVYYLAEEDKEEACCPQ